jgi:hypothetical protein
MSLEIDLDGGVAMVRERRSGAKFLTEFGHTL